MPRGRVDVVSAAKAGVAWNMAFRFSTHASNFLVGIVLARLVPPSEFGTLAIVTIYVTIISSLSDAGLVSGLVQRRHVHPVHFDSVNLSNLATSTALFLGAFISAPYIARFYGDPRLGDLIHVVSIVIVLNGIATVPQAVLKRTLGFRRLAMVRFTSALVSGGTGIVLALRGAGIWALVAQQLAASASILLLSYISSQWRPRLAFSVRALRQLAAYSTPLYLSRLLDVVFSRLDVLVFARLIPMDSLGNYERAKAINTLIMSYAFQPMVEVLFPALSLVNRNTRRVANLVVLAVHMVSFPTFYLMGVLFVTADALVVALYGEAWRPAGEYIRYIALAAFAFPISALLATALSSRGRSGTLLGTEVIKKTILALHLMVGITWGFEAFLAGLAVRSAIAVAINLHYAARELQVSRRTLAMPIVAQALVCALGLAAHMGVRAAALVPAPWDAVASLFAYSIVYLTVSHAVGTAAYRTFVRLLCEHVAAVRKKAASGVTS